jgi:hypothetical protein
MNSDYPFIASARVASSDPMRLISKTAQHLEQHGAQITVEKNGETVLEYEFYRGVLAATHDYLLLRTEAPDISFLQEIKSELGAHVEEFAGMPAGSISWEGDAGLDDTPPNFRLMTVQDVFDLFPSMTMIVA